MLVRSAAITPEQSQKALEMQTKTPHKRVGQILLEMNAITLEQLHSTVKTQVQSIYRKLDVKNRWEAKEAARRLDLL